MSVDKSPIDRLVKETWIPRLLEAIAKDIDTATNKFGITPNVIYLSYALHKDLEEYDKDIIKTAPDGHVTLFGMKIISCMNLPITHWFISREGI